MKKRMKRLLMVCALVCLALPAHAQQPVTVISAAVTDFFLEQMHGAAIMHYADMIKQTYETMKNTYDAAMFAYKLEQRAIDNIKAAANIRSFDDAKNWHNKQLTLEREATNAINKTMVGVGNVKKSVVDIADRASSPDWLEVSEDERKAVYKNLGISPANYAYLRTWQKMDREMLETGLGKVEAYKAKREAAAKYRQAMAELYANPEGGLDSISLIKDQNALQIDAIDVQEDIRAELAEMNMRATIDEQQKKYLAEKSKFSYMFNFNFGEPPVRAQVDSMEDPE